MIFSLDVRRARHGDCMLLHYGTEDDPGLIVIDGGPGNVYTPFLKPRLQTIRDARRLGQNDALPVDMLMVSHVDDDHIFGILELTSELVDRKRAGKRLPLKIRRFWHNTFDDIIGNSSEELRAAVTASFGAASLSAEPDVDGFDEDVAKVLASVGQGIRLRDDARFLNLPVNPEFDGRLVMAAEDGAALDLGRGLTFTVAGPMKDELIALQKEHDAFLKKKKEDRGRASLAAFSDTSVANLSSIVVIAKAGGKSMLLTGDARGDKLLKGLRLAGALGSDGRLHVDLLKMPHHGSDRNMTQEFLEQVTADHYVCSGDGEHGNPERETLEMLRRARGNADYTIYLTYPLDETDAARKAEWIEHQERERARRTKNPNVVVRTDWSDAEHSLTAFFEQHRPMADRLKIAAAGGHVIDLLAALPLPATP